MDSTNSIFSPWLGICGCGRQLYTLFHIILYKGLDLQILVSGDPDTVDSTNAPWILGDDYLSFGGVKSVAFLWLYFYLNCQIRWLLPTTISPFPPLFSLSFMLTTRLYVDDLSHFGFLMLCSGGQERSTRTVIPYVYTFW